MTRTETLERVFELKKIIKDEAAPLFERVRHEIGNSPVFFGYDRWKERKDRLLKPYSTHPAVVELTKIRTECPHEWGPWYESNVGPWDLRDCSVCGQGTSRDMAI
jgi:hypothetical protein